MSGYIGRRPTHPIGQAVGPALIVAGIDIASVALTVAIWFMRRLRYPAMIGIGGGALMCFMTEHDIVAFKIACLGVLGVLALVAAVRARAFLWQLKGLTGIGAQAGYRDLGYSRR